jgi:hypothetical protein
MSWRERANSELEKIVELFSSKQLPDLCAKALINAPERSSSKWTKKVLDLIYTPT